ncbi:OB-fold domain-containing protein [Pseudonocardia sp. C8]|uniref:Zn-ribbon domain-containing OB-fold protein n=1 Tax=Pseudonocardia sp. C8 TaxID=2762759 RepID=UPI001642B98B|nr:OB-fold domain-containing protein [Pseudonocardia sp. C8]MBC3192973.1 OB-fold domain-containing protein [Pseudonocardia sp. C8]
MTTDSELAGYHAGLAAGELRAPWCLACERFSWPPRPVCPHCTAGHVEWRPLERSASLFTWTVVGRSTLPEFHGTEPYAVGVLDFEDAGIRVVGYIDASPDELYIGAPMTLQVRPRGSLGPQACWRIEEDG